MILYCTDSAVLHGTCAQQQPQTIARSTGSVVGSVVRLPGPDDAVCTSGSPDHTPSALSIGLTASTVVNAMATCTASAARKTLRASAGRIAPLVQGMAVRETSLKRFTLKEQA